MRAEPPGIEPPTRRVAFATWRGQPGLTADDGLAVEPLERLGIRVAPAVWSRRGVAWREFDAVVLRSTWDYHVRLPLFERWLAHLEAEGVPVFNAPALVRWNLDKRYLEELAGRGIAVEPAARVEMGARVSLPGLLAERGWVEAVVKPAVSASAHRTWRTTPRAGAGDQARLDAMLRRAPVLVQRLNDRIREVGEWSFVFLGGAGSHAVVKRPAAGEFRVQEKHGGSIAPIEPPPAIWESAGEALRAAVSAAGGAPPVYARIDGVPEGNELIVMEVELIEPSLFLARAPGTAGRGAPERFAAALAAALGGARLNESATAGFQSATERSQP